MVSTDDPEIAELAKGAGASVPFLRSAQTANDYASTDDVIREVLECYRAAGRSLTRSAVSTPPRRLLPPKAQHCDGAFKGRRVRHAGNDFSVSGSAQPCRR